MQVCKFASMQRIDRRTSLRFWSKKIGQDLVRQVPQVTNIKRIVDKVIDAAADACEEKNEVQGPKEGFGMVGEGGKGERKQGIGVNDIPQGRKEKKMLEQSCTVAPQPEKDDERSPKLGGETPKEGRKKEKKWDEIWNIARNRPVLGSTKKRKQMKKERDMEDKKTGRSLKEWVTTSTSSSSSGSLLEIKLFFNLSRIFQINESNVDLLVNRFRKSFLLA